jgi:hypothetical protein
MDDDRCLRRRHDKCATFLGVSAPCDFRASLRDSRCRLVWVTNLLRTNRKKRFLKSPSDLSQPNSVAALRKASATSWGVGLTMSAIFGGRDNYASPKENCREGKDSRQVRFAVVSRRPAPPTAAGPARSAGMFGLGMLIDNRGCGWLWIKKKWLRVGGLEPVGGIHSNGRDDGGRL